MNDVVASLQRIFKVKSPTSGGFYSGIVGAEACLEEAGDVHAEGRRQREPTKNTVTINLDGARPRVQVQARRAARDDPAGELAAERRGHEADSRHRAVLLRVVQPEQAARA